MIRAWQIVGALLLATVACAGCKQDTPQVKTFQVKMATGVEQAKQVLQRYAEGASLGSEVTSFDQIVADVKKTDAQKADVLAKGFADLQKGGDTAGKAKELLSATDMRSSQIAFEVGYNDPHYFSYLFKKSAGMTPSEYRKQEKENQQK